LNFLPSSLRALFSDSLLDIVLPALDHFVREIRVKLSDIEFVGSGLKKLLNDKFLGRVTKNHQWLYQVSKNNRGWVLTDSNKRVRLLPRPDSDDYARVYETFPALDELEHTIYAEQEKCHIIPGGAGDWTVNELKQVLEINVDVVFRSSQLITYLNLFITRSGECLCLLKGKAGSLVLFTIRDRVTGSDRTINIVTVGVHKKASGELSLLKGEEIVGALNSALSARQIDKAPESAVLTEFLEYSREFLMEIIDQLGLPFQLPDVEPVSMVYSVDC
ncbi:hypothetical protein, partial [Endozoicomonas sp. ONNA2]|uniref:hypothetical protein n=1 Tax=Endozoicomonas sp. ONNA2 TaxID=2828741 RepID=UPI002148B22C